LPKVTDDQKKKRRKAIQEGYKTAAQVPLDTARTCFQILDNAKTVAEIGNLNSISDAAVSALVARSGVESAILNVKINLCHIKDEDFVKKINNEIENIQKNLSKKTREILKIVNSKI
jgi:formiminotetrahydrofolate cyclodeaminase